jgi:hypothetical protein
LRKAIESNDAAAISRAMEELTQAQHKAAASLYQQASAGPGAGPQPGSGDGPTTSAGAAAGGGREASGDVIDAEVVDEGKP